ncbi:MAG: MIP/aquaporin family protein [Candidatus Puniceispirillaceae bacterium]|jgi:glycerol uptake facilitator-like aquaporin|nr:aquaporin family protein [Candidatus Puniceispirillum sp.]MBL6674291.1 aquaporin family protein [Candidatus Puniceispirillum sp.]MDB2528115.1 aquaporin family protein [Alphaproteobacteria bacterium]
MVSLSRRLFAEWFGTMMLVATVVGSGIMAEQLAGGNVAIALLGNTIATGAILVVLITILGPLSGAHFNPAVSFAFALRGEITPKIAALYAIWQIIGGLCGTVLAHLMFEQTVWQTSAHMRSGMAQYGSEFVATFGLLAVIFGGICYRQTAVPWLVGLYITAAYWFTASTSFANPAVTIARSFTDSFSGIFPGDMPFFIIAQMLAAAAASLVCGWLFADQSVK